MPDRAAFGSLGYISVYKILPLIIFNVLAFTLSPFVSIKEGDKRMAVDVHLEFPV